MASVIDAPRGTHRVACRNQSVALLRSELALLRQGSALSGDRAMGVSLPLLGRPQEFSGTSVLSQATKDAMSGVNLGLPTTSMLGADWVCCELSVRTFGEPMRQENSDIGLPSMMSVSSSETRAADVGRLSGFLSISQLTR